MAASPRALPCSRRYKHFTSTTNALSGPIPFSHCELRVHLKNLRLDQNNLTGGVPTCLGQFPVLKKLDMSLNMLHGSVPTELGAAFTLTILNLHVWGYPGEPVFVHGRGVPRSQPVHGCAAQHHSCTQPGNIRRQQQPAQRSSATRHLRRSRRPYFQRPCVAAARQQPIHGAGSQRHLHTAGVPPHLALFREPHARARAELHIIGSVAAQPDAARDGLPATSWHGPAAAVTVRNLF